MLQDINLNLYKVFYAVASCNSFKLAAEKLYVSQPAISKQIIKLEDILGVKLFYRFNKKISLTKEGKILYEQLEKTNFYLEAAAKYISMAKENEIGELVIGCQSHITSFYLLDHIEKFKNDYPNVKISIVNDSTSTLVDLLLHNKIDFIIDNYPIEVNSKECIIKKIDSVETILIVSNEYSEKINKIEDLNDKELILPLPRSSIRKNLMRILFEHNINVKVSLAVDTTDLIISSVKKNLGIGYVIKKSVKKELQENQIKELKLDCELPKIEIDLVYIKDYLSYPAKEFLENYIKAI